VQIGSGILKIDTDCPECLMHRGFIETRKATSEPRKRLKTSIAMLKAIVENLKPDAVPGVIGTIREEVIGRETGNNDLYAVDKRESNTQALSLLPGLRDKITGTQSNVERFRLASRLSAIGNLIEFDILGYSVRLDQLEAQIQQVEFGIDNSDSALELSKSSKNVMLLTDNAGEIAFDILLVEELKRIGLSVTVAVKNAPIMNDATLEDALQVGMNKVADNVITTGQACVGLLYDDTSPEFRQVLDKMDLIVAKGMGHYETMTERNWNQPILHVLIAKCRPVASSLGIMRGQGAILLRRPKV